jgi:peroxiredoxin
MSEAVKTYEGWYAYHDFRKIDWTRWKSLSPEKRDEAIRELVEVLREFASVEESRGGSFGQYAVLGHKADLLFIHFRPTLEALNEVKWRFDKTAFADVTSAPTSFISVVELSAYTVPPGTDPMSDPAFRERLPPSMPKAKYVCFYPMNKRRNLSDNWYMLPMEERRKMMKSHGMIGRSYAGKVRQIVTGSIGLDDWEWGVSLFADDPLHFKKIVTEMRFDEVSARFGEFGPFYIGARLTEEGLVSLLKEQVKG